MTFASISLSGVKPLASFSKRASLLLISALIFTVACSGRASVSDGAYTPAALSVVVTFDALFELAVVIGGDRVSVTNLMPANADAHHFEPSARDLALLNSAEVFIICGLGFDLWAESAVKSAGNDSIIVCDVSRGIEPVFVSNRTYEESGLRAHDSDDAGYDPHIWLSPTCAAAMAENIRDTFIEADPDGADHFRRGFDELARQLDGLFEEYSEKYNVLENKTLVTGHAVFAYLCRDFGLSQNSIEGVFADGEPSARELAELIDFCREGNITTILAESLSSPLVAETLAAEAGAAVRVIYTMESAEDGLSYLARMEHNLSAIYDALQ